MCMLREDIYIYIYGIQWTLLSKETCSNSYIHSYTDGGGCHARCRPAHQEQFGVQYLAHGHFNMKTRGIEPLTFHSPLIENCFSYGILL